MSRSPSTSKLSRVSSPAKVRFIFNGDNNNQESKSNLVASAQNSKADLTSEKRIGETTSSVGDLDLVHAVEEADELF
jgi:hypothetical protein